MAMKRCVGSAVHCFRLYIRPPIKSCVIVVIHYSLTPRACGVYEVHYESQFCFSSGSLIFAPFVDLLVDAALRSPGYRNENCPCAFASRT
jgi:hypothetical protein